ncbi:MAG: GAF domain-containing protein [Anaerolineae bacterium]|nr:GAF domain-containing protein [Anaerolineae bacterium]
MQEAIRLLLVDDDDRFRAQLCARLARKGIEVEDAANGPQALQMAAACGGRYDVALIDQVMPPPNGIETMRRLRELYPEIEVIILTGWGDVELGQQAMDAGAHRYLTKPIQNTDDLAINLQMAAQYGWERQRRLGLQALVRAGQVIGAAQSHDALYTRLYAEARALLPALDSFVVAQYDSANAILTFRFCKLQDTDLELPPRQGENGILEYVVREGQPLGLPYGDASFRQKHQLAPPHPARGPAQSLIAVPVFVGEQLWGVIEASTGQENVRYTREHVEIMQAFANQVSVVIRNLEQLEEARQLQRALAALAGRRGAAEVERAIVTQAHELIGHDYTSLILHAPDGTLYKARPVMPPTYVDEFEEPRQHEGISRYVIETGQRVTIEDVQRDPRVKESIRQAGIRSILALPLIHGRRVSGVLFTHTLKPWRFAEHHLSLWQAFAAQAAAVLHDALEESVSEVWKTLDRQIATCEDRAEIYRLFAEQARAALHADLAVYYPHDPTVPGARSRLVLGECIHVGTLRTPWEIPRGGLGGGVHDAIDSAPDGLLIVNDLSGEHARWQSRLTQREGIRAFVGLRLQVLPEGQRTPRTVGMLFLNFRRTTSFAREDLVGLQLAGSRVAAAIQRLYLLDVLERQRQRLNERLRAIVEVFEAYRERHDTAWILNRIAATIRETLGLDACLLIEHDAAQATFGARGGAGLGQPVERYVLDHEAMASLLDAPDPVVIQVAEDDPRYAEAGLVRQEGMHTLIVCPLRAEGERPGLLVAGYRRQKAIEGEELEAVAVFADLAGLMLRDARLQDALDHARKRTEQRRFLHWMTMVEGAWRHSLEGKGAAIRNHVAILEKRLAQAAHPAQTAAGIAETLQTIDRLAKEVASAPTRAAQSWEWEPEPLPLAPLLEEMAQREAQPSLPGSPATVTIETAVEGLSGVQVRGHRRWLISALEGLLQNAARAMPEGGTIAIHGTRNERWAEVRIRDTGAGVPSAIQRKLFREPIPRTLLSQQPGSPGMGIGALLSAWMIEHEGGSITLERPGPGDTTVLVRLPIAEEAGQ